MTDGIPEKLWLQYYGDGDPEFAEGEPEWSEVTHSLDRIYESDVLYVRADILKEAVSLLKEIEWLEDPENEYSGECPSCSATESYTGHRKHLKGCWMAEVLKRAEGLGVAPCARCDG